MNIWSDETLNEYWVLSTHEKNFPGKKTGAILLVVALKLKHFQYYGNFPEKAADFPMPIGTFVAKQLNCDPDCIKDYLFVGIEQKNYIMR